MYNECIHDLIHDLTPSNNTGRQTFLKHQNMRIHYAMRRRTYTHVQSERLNQNINQIIIFHQGIEYLLESIKAHVRGPGPPGRGCCVSPLPRRAARPGRGLPRVADGRPASLEPRRRAPAPALVPVCGHKGALADKAS